MNTFLELLNYMEKTGKLPMLSTNERCYGLCTTVEKYLPTLEKIFDYFSPCREDPEVHLLFWGSGGSADCKSRATDLRKTIIAFCAAINNEL